MNTNITLADVLGNDFVKDIARDLRIEAAEHEEQGSIIFEIAMAVFEDVVQKVTSALPNEAHAELRSLLEKGDSAAVRELMGKHVDNLDEFIRMHAKKSYERIKARAEEIMAEEAK